MLNFWKGVEQVEQTHHGSPPKLEDDMGRLADWWIVTGLARSFAGGISPRVFFCVKKMHPMFFCCMSSHVMKQFVKLNSMMSELNSNCFTTNKIIQNPYIHPSAMVRSVLFVALCENGTCWSQQKKTQIWCNWRVSPQPAPHGSYGNLKYPLQSHFWRCVSFSLCRIC